MQYIFACPQREKSEQRIEDAGEVYMDTHCSDGLIIRCAYYGITKVVKVLYTLISFTYSSW